MRSPSLGWLFAKEGRELLASRAYWLMLVLISLLVGQGFITAVNLYAEASGVGGGSGARLEPSGRHSCADVWSL